MIFTPWIAGERSPVDDRNARGGWHNLSVETGTADLVRSVLEGVAYNSRWLNDAVESFAKRRLDPLRIFGGGAIPDLWCQIHADVMDRTIERVADPMYANLRGAALFAALGLGEISRDDVRELVPSTASSSPTPPRATSTTASTPSSRASTRPSARCSLGSTADAARATSSSRCADRRGS